MFFQLDEVTKNKYLLCFHSLIIRIYIYMTTWDEKPRPCPECRSAHGFLILPRLHSSYKKDGRLIWDALTRTHCAFNIPQINDKCMSRQLHVALCMIQCYRTRSHQKLDKTPLLILSAQNLLLRSCFYLFCLYYVLLCILFSWFYLTDALFAPFF